MVDNHLSILFTALGIDGEAKQRSVVELLARAGIPLDVPTFTVPRPLPAPAPKLVLLDPNHIRSEPATYQFRSGGDAAGVTSTGRYATNHWDPILHGDPLLLHERADGIFVADGHHRLQLAQRLNAMGTGPGRIAAQVLRAADGYSAHDVKIIAAYKNIQHGRTDSVETARVFKEAESVHAALLPKLDMTKGNLALSHRLSKLADPALNMVADGSVPATMAADVASHVPQERQESVMGIIREKLGFSARLKEQRATNPAKNNLSI